jgi:hypothetical protein
LWKARKPLPRLTFFSCSPAVSRWIVYGFFVDKKWKTARGRQSGKKKPKNLLFLTRCGKISRVFPVEKSFFDTL